MAPTLKAMKTSAPDPKLKPSVFTKNKSSFVPSSLRGKKTVFLPVSLPPWFNRFKAV